MTIDSWILTLSQPVRWYQGDANCLRCLGSIPSLPFNRWWAAWTLTPVAMRRPCECRNTGRKWSTSWPPWCVSCLSSSTAPHASSQRASSSTVTASARGSFMLWVPFGLASALGFACYLHEALMGGEAKFSVEQLTLLSSRILPQYVIISFSIIVILLSIISELSIM